MIIVPSAGTIINTPHAEHSLYFKDLSVKESLLQLHCIKIEVYDCNLWAQSIDLKLGNVDFTLSPVKHFVSATLQVIF